MDDLRARIERALEEVDQLSGSLNEIDALKSALGQANTQLKNNADQVGQLAHSTETFRRSVEGATNVLASLAEELSSADAVQIGRAISNSEANLKETIEGNTSDLRVRLDTQRAEDRDRLTSALERLDNGHQRLSDEVDAASSKVEGLIERQSRTSAADAVQIGKAISGSEANLKEVIEAKSAGVQDRLGKDLADVLSRLKSGLMQLDNGQERLLKEVKQSTAKVTELVEVLSRVVVDQQMETRERFGETSRRLDVMLAELREVARRSARTRTKWMVALVGINVISASAVAVLMVVLLG